MYGQVEKKKGGFTEYCAPIICGELVMLLYNIKDVLAENDGAEKYPLICVHFCGCINYQFISTVHDRGKVRTTSYDRSNSKLIKENKAGKDYNRIEYDAVKLSNTRLQYHRQLALSPVSILVAGTSEVLPLLTVGNYLIILGSIVPHQDL